MELVIKCKGENYIVLIDEEDYDRVSKYNWYISHYKSNIKYCVTHVNINGKKTTLKLHRFIIGLDHGDKRIINHIDGNGLNNKKSNLEICDAMYNTQSINTKKNFGSICIDNRKKKKYRAQVHINKKYYSKYFYTYTEAESWLEGLKQVAIAETLPFTN
jgi:hypothetical protein